MIRFIVAILALLIATPGLSQVRQSGTVTPRHPVCWTTTGVVQDCGTAALPFATSFGTWGEGPTVCTYSQNPGSALNYQRLCFGAANATGGVITVDTFGGAPSGSLQFTVNGVNLAFNTTVLPTISGNAACFSNTTGTITDCTQTGTGAVVLATGSALSGPTITSPIITGGSIAGTAGDFSSLALNGVPIGTSTDSYWNNVGGGNIAYTAGNVAAYKLNSGPSGLVVDARFYGAACDGSTDDSTAFTNARVAIVSAGGGTLIIPEGTCILNSATALEVASAVSFTIQGHGIKSVLKAKNSASLASIITTSTTTSFLAKDFVIDGNLANTGVAGNGVGIILFGSNSTIDNVEIKGTKNGVWIGPSNAFSNFTIQNSYIHDNQITGVFQAGATGPVNVSITGSRFERNYNTSAITDSAAINIAQVNGLLVSNNYFLNNYNIGGGQVVVGYPSATAAQNMLIANNVIEQTGTVTGESTGGVESGGTNYEVTGNVIINSKDVSILASCGSGILVTSNLVTSVGAGIAVNAGCGGLGPTKITISDNQIMSGATGISLTTPTPTGNALYVLNNYIDAAVTTPISGAANADAVEGNTRGNWQSWSPTYGSNTGAPGSVSTASARYILGTTKLIFSVRATITTVAPATAFLTISLPATTAGPCATTGINQTTGTSANGYVASGSSTLIMWKYDGLFPAADGNVLIVSGECQI